MPRGKFVSIMPSASSGNIMSRAQHNEVSESSLGELKRRFHLVRSEVKFAGRCLEIFRPESADELISEEDFNCDERLPHWAEIWASSIALAMRLATEAGAGRRLLELGCGVGLVSTAASRQGFDVTAIDYYAEALEFTRFNAIHNGQPPPTTRLVDWRDCPKDLGRFDAVVASDVLYERPYSDLIAAAFAATLEPDGLGILTDPQRQIAAPFPEACRRHGLTIVRTSEITVARGVIAQAIDLYVIRLNGSTR
jgi:predicted nicotinamide N-methyase